MRLTFARHLDIIRLHDKLIMIGILHTVIFLNLISAAKGDCDSLPIIENTTNNATGTGPFVSGTIIRFECDSAFNPAGTKREYRCSGTEWVEGDFRCEEIFCSYVETPENGRVVNEPTNQIGTTISFKCNEGYIMVGQSAIMICRIDGEWLPREPPKCEIRMCGEFGSIQHGSVFQDSSYIIRNGYGSITEVTCDENYIIKGNPRVMCMANGNWDEKPTCVESTCPPYPGLNSSCVKETNVFGVYLFIVCRDDVPVTRNGPDQAECDHGAWDHTDITCYCHCKVEADRNTVSLKNVGSNDYLRHDTTLQWSCENNYEKDTSSNLHCYDGNVIKPVCKARTTAKPVTVTYKPVINQDESTVDTTTDKGGSTVNPTADKGGSTVNPTADKGGYTVNPTADNGGSIVNPIADKEGSTYIPTADKEGSKVNPTAEKRGSTVNPTADKWGSTVNPTAAKEGSPVYPTADKGGSTVNPTADKEESTVNPSPTTPPTNHGKPLLKVNIAVVQDIIICLWYIFISISLTICF